MIFLFINFVNVILKKIKIIFIRSYLHSCKTLKEYISNSPISVITSISLKLHQPSTIPHSLRIGSQSRKYQEIMEQKQRVKRLFRFDVETTQKNSRGKLIHIQTILKIKSTSNFPRRIDFIIFTLTGFSKSMKSWILTSNRWQIDEDVFIGSSLTKKCKEVSQRPKHTTSFFTLSEKKSHTNL